MNTVKSKIMKAKHIECPTLKKDYTGLEKKKKMHQVLNMKAINRFKMLTL